MDSPAPFLDAAFWITSASILALLLLSAFFSGSETALTAASRGKLRAQADKGNRGAEAALKITEDNERLIGSVLLGNNLVNILAASLATALFTRVFGDSGVALATLVMTLLVLIFAEVMPKTYAIRNPDKVALAVAPVIGVLVPLLAPAVNAVQAIVRVVLKVFGLYEMPDNGVSVEDELKGTIELHAREGTVRKTAKDMLGSILELDNVDLSEVMMHRRRVVMLNADDPPEKIISEALAANYTRIPLYKGEREEVVGVLHAKDLARELAKVNGDPSQVDIAAVAREPWFVPETTTLREQLNAFRRRHAHFALVIDEYGDLQGVVTLEDILEEIVGDISDEHDAAGPSQGVKPLPGGAYEVEGSVTIRDLNRRFDWSLPDEEAATIAGLVVYEAQTLPDPGQIFRFHGFTFEVLERRRNRINRLRLTPPEPEQD